MNTETIQTAASIVAPIGGDQFDGTLDEATDAMVAFAAEVRAQDGADAQSALARMLANSDADRVAEIAAVALLRLADQTKPAHWDPTSPQHAVIRAAINWRKAILVPLAEEDLTLVEAVDALPHIGEPTHDTSQPTLPFPLAEGDTVTVTMPARVAGLPDPEADPGAADELWDFTITVAGETEYVSLTQAEVARAHAAGRVAAE